MASSPSRSFWLLLGAVTAAGWGTWLLVVALPIHVYALTGSVTATAATVIAEALPAVLLAPMAGLLVDRLDRRRVLAFGYLLRAGAVAGLLAVNDAQDLWLLYVLVLAENACTQLTQTTQRSLVPAAAGRGPALGTANAWLTAVAGVVRLVAAPTGGALYSAWGFDAAVLANALTLLLAAALAARLPTMLGAAAPADRTITAARQRFVRRAGDDLLVGGAFLLRHRVLRPLLMVSALFLLANGVLTVLVVPYVSDELGGGGPELGLLFSALGAGYLLSAPLGRALDRGVPLRASATGCLVTAAVCFAGLFHTSTTSSATLAAGLLGIPAGALLLLVQTQVQRHAPDHLLGRTASVFVAAESIATVSGAAVGGVLADAVGLRTTADLTIPVVLIAAVIAVLPTPPEASGSTER